MMRRASESDEPGTGTQCHIEATMNPLDDPTFDVEDEREVRGAQRYTFDGRTWVCGRDYLDTVTKDVAKLTSVIRKSPWCSNKPAEEGTLFLCFEFERAGSLQFQPGSPEVDPKERFLERYRNTTNRGP